MNKYKMKDEEEDGGWRKKEDITGFYGWFFDASYPALTL